ncbi:MAG: hypothetical protein E3J83_04255 [Candidatus Atribacteria bacterium]|nr:MAG: hypothetical protein E3J83_04255 [Candidatus Atribacteria bacterium]
MFKKKNWKKACKKAKTTRRKLRDQLDKLWAEIVKKRAGNKCEYCRKTTYLNTHHIFSRSNLSVRWDLDNGVCLCAGHHTLSNNSAHKSPAEFIEWIKEMWGIGWYEDLRKKANQIKKWTIPELKELVKEFKSEAK